MNSFTASRAGGIRLSTSGAHLPALRAADPVSRAELARLDVVRWEPVPAPERQYE